MASARLAPKMASVIWRNAVDATHDFLTPEDRIAIDEQVQQFLPQSPLWLAVDETDRAVGFMGLVDSRMALFIDPAYHAIDVGRALVAHAVALSGGALTSDVNEQNERAIGFYERLGFIRTRRSPIDDYGRAYPLIHLRLEPKG